MGQKTRAVSWLLLKRFQLRGNSPVKSTYIFLLTCCQNSSGAFPEMPPSSCSFSWEGWRWRGQEHLFPLSSFLLDRMLWAIDVLGWHSASFANTPSSALLLCDVNISIISLSLHHSLTTCTHSAKQVPKTALSLCPLPPHNKRCQAPSSTNTAEFHPAGE